MDSNLEEQAEKLTKRVRHYLLTSLGRDPKKAYPWEIFQAISFALRELIIVNWTATLRTVNQHRKRRLYYLSMEYLPGRMLVNNISNLNLHPLMKKVMAKLGYNYNEALLLEPDPGLGNGGLGRLASCFLDSLATQKYPGFAYGLRYQYGIFEQQICDGIQQEKPDCWLLNENPWQLRRDSVSKIVKFAGLTKKRFNSYQEPVFDLYDYEEVRALPFDFPVIGYSPRPDFNVITLRLWSTKESPGNFQLQRYNAGQIGQAAENTGVTDVLYPSDNHDTGKRIRLKQEFLLVSASIQDIIYRHLLNFPDLSNFKDVVRIQINDTHAALVIAELMRLLTKWHLFSWEKAFEVTQEVVGFTNHTVMKEALEEWNQERFSQLLPRQYAMIEEINRQLCDLVRKKYPGDEEKVRSLSIVEGGQIRMAHLAIYGSHCVNGVARLHGDILKKEVFKDFYTLFPKKFTYITNGVTQRHWLLHCNPQLAEFINERIGDKWITDFSQIENLKEYASDPTSQKRFLEIKQENKKRLQRYLYEKNPQRDFSGKIINPHPDLIDTHSLFAMHIKRFHEYKRQLMNALHLIMVYFDLLKDPHGRKVKRTVFFAGKAAAGYAIAKTVIQLIHCIARKINHDPAIEHKLKVIFVENYSVTRAEKLIPAADLSEQISTAGMEASGTGNMKLAINGALTIGTQDGANIEMQEAIQEPWWPFAFGATSEELNVARKRGSYNPLDIYARNPKIGQALDSLKDGTFSQNAQEEEALATLFDSLLRPSGAERADRYFVLQDLENYYDTQLKVETLYQNPAAWAETAIHNIAGMGEFSSDRAIVKYANRIWGIHPEPLDPQIFREIREIFQ